MEEWKEYKLGDLIKLSSGGTPDKNNDSYWGGAIPWISAKSMYDDYLYSSDLTITNEGLVNGSRIAPVNSILLLTRGSGLFNRIPVCLVKKEMAFNQDVKCLESKDQDVVSNLFLYYWLMGNKHEISAIIETTGIGAGKIDTERLKNIKVKLPPVRTQKALVQFAESIMLKIEVNRRINDNFAFSFLLLTCFVLWLLKLINDNLQQQAQALYKSWFIDFEPFKGDKFEDSELGMIPRGWSVKQLGEITTQVNEKVKERVDVKVLSPITTGELVLSEEYFTKQVFSESISKYIVVKPTYFAYNPARVNIGSLGMNEYGFDGCVSPVYVVFRCEDDYQYFFDLFRRTETFKEEVKARAIGGVRQSLTYKDFSLIKVVYPPIDVIHSFNQVYSRILAKTKHNNVETTRLASIRDTLLPKLMSGELKIS